jgi:hypothetical protein
MARARTIKPGYFTNDLLAQCDPLARILFAGLWTIADRDGRMVFRPARIKAQVLPYDACDIDDLIAQLQHRRFIVIYEIEGVRYLQVEGFGKHQNPHPREVSENIPEPTAESEVTESREKVLPSHEKVLPSPGNAGTSNALSPLPSPLSPSPIPLSLQSLDACDARPKRRQRSNDPLRWNEESGWQGITDEDHDRWLDLFPAVDSRYELKRLDQWLRDNPTKAHKSNWRRWLNKLFAGKQDKGGSSSGGTAPAPSAPRARQRNEEHIPADCHPDDRYLWWDNGFPFTPNVYRNHAGQLVNGHSRNVISV